jgi:hypothetical protein
MTSKTVKLPCLLLNNVDIKNCMIGSLTDKTEKMLAAFYTPKTQFLFFFSHHALDIVYKLLASYIA